MSAAAARRPVLGGLTRRQRHEIEHELARRKRRQVLAAISGLLALALLDAAIDPPLVKSEGMLFHVRADSVRWGSVEAFPLDVEGDGDLEIVAAIAGSAYDREDYLQVWSSD